MRNFPSGDLLLRPMAGQRVPLPGWRNATCLRNDYFDHFLVIALLGGFSGIGGGPFYGTGYYGGGGLGLIIVILLILLLLGRI